MTEGGSEALFDSTNSSPIARQPDGSGFVVHYAGGLRGFEVDKNCWKVSPFVGGSQAFAKGVITKRQLWDFAVKYGLKPIAFQSIDCRDGSYHSTWVPIIPGSNRNFPEASTLWRNISSNMGETRVQSRLRNVERPSLTDLSDVLDDCSTEEEVSQCISLSLRNMDICVEHISEFYYEQLIELIYSSFADGSRVATSRDQRLYAYVQSFFVHLGSARDYLAKLISARIGIDTIKYDSLARLVDALRPSHFRGDALLCLLQSEGLLKSSPRSASRWLMSGWFDTATILRKEFVHKRPYGQKFLEGSGFTVELSAAEGLHRYTRPICLPEGKEQDILDCIIALYHDCNSLFRKAVELSGYDSEFVAIGDKEIISIELK